MIEDVDGNRYLDLAAGICVNALGHAHPRYRQISGFGRTGRWFGCEHSGVRPDVMTLGKGLGSGFPVSGLVSTEVITKATPWANPSGSSSSYGGNPLAGAAVYASVTVIEEEDLVANAACLGEWMLARFREMQERHEFIGNVQGRAWPSAWS